LLIYVQKLEGCQREREREREREKENGGSVGPLNKPFEETPPTHGCGSCYF
jgi:hypothetical protein